MLNLQTPCGVRKRIWEVDCLSMDAAIAAAFDWRELANFIASEGLQIEEGDEPGKLEMRIQSTIHHYCHSENRLSVSIETLLNHWFAEEIHRIASLEKPELMALIAREPFLDKKKIAAWVWALGSDPRAGLDCLRRKWHQRFQVVSLRRLV